MTDTIYADHFFCWKCTLKQKKQNKTKPEASQNNWKRCIYARTGVALRVHLLHKMFTIAVAHQANIMDIEGQRRKKTASS